MAPTMQQILNSPAAIEVAARAMTVRGRQPTLRRPTWLMDPVVVGALRRWARSPWDQSHGMVLADRLEEMQLYLRAQDTRNLFVSTIQYQRPGEPEHATVQLAEVRNLPRRLRGVLIRCWQKTLVEYFGDFLANTLPCEAPADTTPN